MSSYAHKVYLPQPNVADHIDTIRHIDTVFADYSDPEEMRRSLIEHDGYDPRIIVVCEGKRSPEK